MCLLLWAHLCGCVWFDACVFWVSRQVDICNHVFLLDCYTGRYPMLILVIVLNSYLQIILSSNGFSNTHTHTQFLCTVCFKCEHSEFWLCILNVYMLMANCFIFAWRMNKDRESPGAWHPSTEAPAVFDPITLLLSLEQAGIC